MTWRQLLRTPLAWLPLATSLAAIALVAWALATIDPNAAPATDEGTPARLWQLLIGLTFIGVASFALVWVPRAGARALAVLGIQIAAVVAAMAPVFLLRL